MGKHVDEQGRVHDDMDGLALADLPQGCMPVTDAEAAAQIARNEQARLDAMPYAIKRAMAYPNQLIELDAKVKQSSAELTRLSRTV